MPLVALLHTCYRITDIDRSVAFYEALGFEEVRRMPIREEAINVFLNQPGGVVVKTAGVGTTTIDAIIKNGTIRAGAGTLTLGGGGSTDGLLIADHGAEIRIDGKSIRRARGTGVERVGQGKRTRGAVLHAQAFGQRGLLRNLQGQGLVHGSVRVNAVPGANH